MGLKKRLETFENRSHFHNLVTLAHLDGHLDKDERKYLNRIGKKMNLSEEEMNELFNAEEYRLILPSSPEDREKLLYDLVCMMMMDGKLLEKEWEYCAQMAEKMGFEREKVKEAHGLICMK